MKILSIVTALVLVLFLIFPEVDLKFSSLFYDNKFGVFPYRETPISMVIYYSVRIFAVLIFMVAFFVATYDSGRFAKIYKIFPFSPAVRNLIKLTKKQAVYLALVLLITPGILVHWVMKPMWDRARPVNIQEFDGKDKYTNFYHLFAGQDGNSFPSGHASMAFSMLAFAYIVSSQRRRVVFAVAFTYGILASLCRVWQGGHFLSDVVFSAIITIWTVLLLKKYYLERE